MRRQRGASAAFVFIVLLLVMVVLGALLTLSRGNTAVDEQVQTRRSLEAASAAIEQFVSSTGRLPCPAKPNPDPAVPAEDGAASPDAPSVNCDYPSTGVLPWQTIGMRHDDAFDAWGWKISYRVYSNTNGSLTQAGGASMVNCDTVQADTTSQPVDGNKLCPVAHETKDSDFLVGKGLDVTDFGAPYLHTANNGAAYVLISHGPSGLGAYTASGSQRGAPHSTEEKNNLKDTGPFTAMAASSPDVAPDDSSHFDDILLYRTVADLAKRANLVARDWPDTIVAGERFDSTRVSEVLGSGTTGDLGVSTLNFGDVSVSAFNSGGATDIAFVSGGTSGLGAGTSSSGGGNDLSSTGGEGLQLNFADPARQVSLSLASFIGFEQAQLVFYSVDPRTLVATAVLTKLQGACGFSSVASFTIDLGSNGVSDPSVTFNRVEIRPWPQVFFGSASTFRVAEVRACVAGVTCQTTIYNSGDRC